MVDRIPAILDGTFFKVVRINNDKVTAACVNCVNEEICGALNATSNFLRHLKVISWLHMTELFYSLTVNLIVT